MNNIRLNKEYVDREIIKRNYIPIDFEIMGYKSKIHFKDNDGYKYSIVWENFLKSKNFKQITYTNPYSLENAKLYLLKNNIPIELISDKINNVSENLLFKGSCGHIIEMSWNKMKRRKNYLCKICIKKTEGIFKQRLDKNIVKEKFNSVGLKIIDINQYEGNRSKIECYDEDNYKYLCKHVDLSCNKFPLKFSVNNPYTIYNINNFININNIQLKLISKKYINSYSLLKWECFNCGEIFEKSWEDIRNNINRNRKLFCQNCFIKSNLENLVQIELESKKIIYEKEYKFKDCKYKRELPFDFYIKDINLCIEVDGEQHYKPVKFGEISIEESEKRFKKQQKKDNIKNQYCKNNNIELLRIPYWDFNKEETYKIKINQYLN